jgi:hypothetical protein
VVGLVTWAGGAFGFSYHITFIEALVFGSIISTTDTVSRHYESAYAKFLCARYCAKTALSNALHICPR